MFFLDISPSVAAAKGNLVQSWLLW